MIVNVPTMEGAEAFGTAVRRRPARPGWATGSGSISMPGSVFVPAASFTSVFSSEAAFFSGSLFVSMCELDSVPVLLCVSVPIPVFVQAESPGDVAFLQHAILFGELDLPRRLALGEPFQLPRAMTLREMPLIVLPVGRPRLARAAVVPLDEPHQPSVLEVVGDPFPCVA
jgi:hypothetical protein